MTERLMMAFGGCEKAWGEPAARYKGHKTHLTRISHPCQLSRTRAVRARSLAHSSLATARLHPY